MDKVSDSLHRLFEPAQPWQLLWLNVSLRSGLDAYGLRESIDALRGLAIRLEDVEYPEIS